MYIVDVLYFILLVFSALTCFVLSVYAYKYRNLQGSTLFAYIMLLGTAWSIANTFELFHTHAQKKLFLGNIQSICVALIPVLIFILVLQFVELSQVVPKYFFTLLFIIPLLTIGFALTNPLHSLITSMNNSTKTYGVWFWTHVVYSYLLITASIFLLWLRPLRKGITYRIQIISFTIGLVITILINFIYLFFGSLIRYDFTPIFLGVASCMIATNIFKYKLFNVMPIVREEIIERMSVGFIILDKEEKVLDMNASASIFVPSTVTNPFGAHIGELFEQWTYHRNQKLEDPKYRWEICNEQNGNIQWYEVDYSILTNRLGNLIGNLIVLHNVTERKLSEEMIKHGAYHNTLTGLPNRKYFTVRSSAELEKAQKENLSFAILYLDLDGFKEINDTYGHDAGDFVLCDASQRLKSIIREGDMVARIGGDELTVLLTNIQDFEDAVLFAQKILKIFSPPCVYNDFKIHLGTSIGISIYPDNGNDIPALLKKADDAMYIAKKSGKGKYHLYQD